MGFHSFSGSDKAKATEIPPFSPPQVIIGTAPCEKSRKGLSSIIGMRTEENLANKHKIIANIHTIITFIEKTIDNTLKPISKNKTAFNISSISCQKEFTYSRVSSLIPFFKPTCPINKPAITTNIGPDKCKNIAN